MDTTSPRIKTLVRDQFRSLKTISETIGFSDDRQRRALRMTAERWAEWSAFLLDGPLPAWPQSAYHVANVGRCVP
jgi:hypothetical protein